MYANICTCARVYIYICTTYTNAYESKAYGIRLYVCMYRDELLRVCHKVPGVEDSEGLLEGTRRLAAGHSFRAATTCRVPKFRHPFLRVRMVQGLGFGF